MPNEDQLPQEIPKGTVHTTGTTIEFRRANQDLAKIVRLEDLESTTDHLLFGVFFQFAALMQRQDLATAAAIKSTQLLEQLCTRSNQATPQIDEIMDTVLNRIKDFQALATSPQPPVVTTPAQPPE